MLTIAAVAHNAEHRTT